VNKDDKNLLLRVARALEVYAEDLKNPEITLTPKAAGALRDRCCLDARDLREYVKRIANEEGAKVNPS
jgi:hypothetical protein